MGNEEMQAAIKELQDAMVVMAHVEKATQEHIMDQSPKLRLRIERNLAEISQKLNKLLDNACGQP